MKKWISLLLVAVLCLSLAACGGKAETSGKETQGQQESQNAEQENPKPSEAGQKEQVIDLTTENWQDYLEFRLFAEPTTNAFDEVTGILCQFKLYLKDDVAQNIIDVNEVALEYSLSGGYGCWYEYQVESNKLIQKEAASEEHAFDNWTEHSSFKLYLSDLKEGRNITSHVGTNSVTIEGNTISFISLAFEKMEVTRIQGTITISQ